MTRKTTVGLAGTGDIGRLHARALSRRADVDLSVCVGVKPGGAQAFARDFGARIYPSYQEMLRDPSVVAVDICVPNDLHRDFAEKAAVAGKHVLCEKPLAMSLEDAEAMKRAAEQAGVLLMVAHPLRFWPEYVMLREVLRSNQLGSCLAITLRRMLSLLISVKGERNWRHRPERMGGAVLDLQIHDLDFLNWTFGLPESVCCSAARSQDGGLNHVYTTLRYSTGLVALVEASYLLQGDPMIFTVKAVCERGTLDYGLDVEHFSIHAMTGAEAGGTAHKSPATLVCYQAGKEPEVLLRQEPDVLDSVFARELSHFVDCVQGKANNSFAPAEEAMGSLRMTLASLQSAQSGQPVSLS